MAESKKFLIKIDENLAGQRADIALASTQLATRSQLRKIFVDNKVTLNAQKIKPSHLLKVGDQIEVELPEIQELSLEPYDFPLDIVYEDDEVIVVNKPAGLVVHPSHGHYNDTLINALMAYQKKLSTGSEAFRPGLVHRIDKDTSGLLVLAKTEKTHNSLARQFIKKTVHRVYLAIVFGNLKEAEGTIRTNIVRSDSDRKKFMATEESLGKHAITHYRVLQQAPHFAFVQLKLETGRTHQIRVHMSHIGHPIVGDDTYNGKKRANNLASQELKKLILSMPRFALHAKELGFTQPVKNQRLEFKCPWPKDLTALFDLCHFQRDETIL
ncbi:MAG: RluA family pseudouridine synthase [Bdellovibrionales bacterium]|nr:RluA family pseudouridine synthase [Bdellovibrionales bacterium]